MSKNQWMWQNNDDGNKYHNFDEDISNLLEFIYSNCKSPKKEDLPFIIPYYSVKLGVEFRWQINFKTMTQTNIKTRFIRKIIRVENGKVWIFYKDGDKSNITVIDDVDTPREYMVSAGSHFMGDYSSENYKPPPVLYKYNKGDVSFECSLRTQSGTLPYECSNGYKLEHVTVEQLNQLLNLSKATVASAPMQPQPQQLQQQQPQQLQQQYQKPSAPRWIVNHDPTNGKMYYVDTTTNQSFWDPPPPPPGYTVEITDDKKLYFFNRELSQSIWAGGHNSKNKKNKKRHSKKNKTYKKKRNNKRKTIKK